MITKLKACPSPCYILDEARLIKNLEILSYVQKEADCHILLASKAFSMYSVFPTIGRYISGTSASSLNEARLGYEEMGRDIHIFSPAYREDEFDEITRYCSHIVFNSYNQWIKHKDKVQERGINAGIRINPEHSTAAVPIYDPCSPGSRMGIRLEEFARHDWSGVDGLHFHTMCEQGADALKETLEAVEKSFGKYIKNFKWINFGGGQHITKENYDIELLIKLIRNFKQRWGVNVYLEPGEAVALNCGYLLSETLDIIENDGKIAIIDTSAACHMPDVLEAPYTPEIENGYAYGEKPYSYTLAGATCLTGDVIGRYSFEEPLHEGSRLLFKDMAIYTMVKNNTFNGINLPAIAIYTKENELKIIKQFGYEDFKKRL